MIRKTTPHQKQVFLLTPLLLLFGVAVTSVCSKDHRRGRTVRKRTSFNFTAHVRDIGSDLFRRLYRVSIDQFQILLQLVQDHLRPTIYRIDKPAATVSPEAKLCVTLRLLAGASYLDVGWPYTAIYGIGRSATYDIFKRTLRVLNKCLPPLSFPKTEEECKESARKFQENRHSPIRGIIAAMDGIAIEIMQPRQSDTPDPRKYFNRKGFYSLCIQAAVGADYKFYFVSARHAGGTHDSTAYQATKLHDLLRGGALPAWASVAADDAYSNGFHILTPYSGCNLSIQKDTFNFYLSSCRIVVEQVFGMLVCRFGIFWSALKYKLAVDTLIVLVACKLHNFIIDTSQTSCFTNIPVAEENNVQGSPTVHLQDLLHTEQDLQRSRQRAREHTALRDRIAERLHALGFIRPRVRRTT